MYIEEMEKFSERVECPKCGWKEQRVLYNEKKELPGEFGGRAYTGEHLVVTCERCRFTRTMATLDTEGGKK